MRSIAFITAILATVLGVGSIAMLINTAATDANSMRALISCVLFVVGSVLAAGSWVKALNINVPSNIKM